ncbi:solute carrier family 12 member 3-like [Lineus longissimus]|uniref:solute carrier family 12 member 3-like n=1 Tax=Lineus longissimus TaxID=88925 RepID=UPI00315C60B9
MDRSGSSGQIGDLKSSQNSLCANEIELNVIPSGETESEKSADKPKSRFKVAKVDFVDEKQPTSKQGENPNDAAESQDAANGYPSPSRSAASGAGSHVGAEGSLASGSTSPPNSPTNRDSAIGQDTTNLKTFGHNTTEALPHVDHYRNLLSATTALRSRPTLEELHDGHDAADKDGFIQDPLLPEENGIAKKAETDTPDHKVVPANSKNQATKFGWVKGVLVRCLLNIWGVMLFIRLSWVVGQAGIGLALVIILLSAVVTTITALSMSAICTNGEVKGGGAYYMISRSLGPEFGGAIGLIFSMANAVAVAMYVVGFAETVRDLMAAHGAQMVDPTNDIRIIGTITLFLLITIAVIGMEWEARAQLVLLVVLIIAIVDFIIGTFIPPTEDKLSKGFVGYRGPIFVENLGPGFRGTESFFSVFAVFFPAATGILAGANISGDLVDPQKDIPRGTLWAILISTVVYLFMACLAGSCIVRDAFGPIASVLLNSTLNSTLNDMATMSTMAMSNLSTLNHTVNDTNLSQCIAEGNCKYGLLNNFQVMEMVSGFGPIVTAGIFSATLSSALASLVGAPKVFQAVCKDKIFPKIHVFAKGYGKNEEPRRAYALTFFIALVFIAIGELNTIAPIISNFFLMSYTLINYSCFDASLAKSPGWRPAFKYYSMWIALAGSLLCLGVMFVINWWTALITFGLVSGLYIYVHYMKPDVNWGSSTQAHVYRNALQSSLKLVSVLDHVKNFRPQILVLSGFPSSRPALVDFASNITKNISLMVCGHIMEGEQSDYSAQLRAYPALAYNWLKKRKIKSFYTATTAKSTREGVQSLIQNTGVGKLRPNTLLMGYKCDWLKDDPVKVQMYFNIIHDAFDLQFGVGILRLQDGLDFSDYSSPQIAIQTFADDSDEESDESDNEHDENGSMFDVSNEGNERNGTRVARFTINPTPSVEDIPSLKPSRTPSRQNVAVLGDPNAVVNENAPNKPEFASINKEVLKTVNRYHKKQPKGTIDVWWLFDDGGLTMLIPYILSNKSQWRHCKLRVFTAATKKGEIDNDQRHMATLLSKFRIDYSSITVLADVGKKPNPQSLQTFQNMTSDWKLNEEAGETAQTHPWKISPAELSTQRTKTNRQLRLRELMLEHSKDATLIVMTLPMPRKGTVSAGLYMAWLETLTKDMPPVLLLRGNQASVLTYYS